MLLSPTSDTKPLVVQAYDGRPSYSCSKCSAVIVGISVLIASLLSVLNCVGCQSLQDELISKSFSGRDGRG